MVPDLELEWGRLKEDLLFSIPAETIREYRDKNLEILPYINFPSNKLSRKQRDCVEFH